jgi:hypothetical protein
MIYYIPNDTTNIKEEILEKNFGKENVVEDKEICLLFATGHMEQRKHSGELLFDDIVNDNRTAYIYHLVYSTTQLCNS